MRLTVLNGSPRGKRSGTRILMEAFEESFSATRGNTCETYYVKKLLEYPPRIEKLVLDSEYICLAFPLYTDIVPGIVKEFLEHLAPLKGKLGGVKMLFLIQSGFPEANHSRYAERYMKHLSSIMGAGYIGTVVKGGVEGIGKRPESFDRKNLEGIREIGTYFGRHGSLDEAMLARYAGPEHLSLIGKLMFMVVAKLINNPMYWNRMMKENGVYNERFACPYKI